MNPQSRHQRVIDNSAEKAILEPEAIPVSHMDESHAPEINYATAMGLLLEDSQPRLVSPGQ